MSSPRADHSWHLRPRRLGPLLTKEVSGQQGKRPAPSPPTAHPPCLSPAAPARAEAAEHHRTDVPSEQLGKNIIFDNTLSNPQGYACFQCHAPTTGGTSGLVSSVNLVAGAPPGVVPGQADHRRAMAYPYAAFSPVGPFYDAEFAMAWVGGCFWDGRVPDLSTQARQPLVNPDEMNNTPTNGIYPPTARGLFRPRRFKKSRQVYAPLFKAIYGINVVYEVHDPRALHPDHRNHGCLRELGRDLPVQLEVRCLQVRGASRGTCTHSPHPRSGGGNSTSASERRTPIAPSATHPRRIPARAGDDQRQGHLHHVLLRQHRRPEELQQPVLSG